MSDVNKRVTAGYVPTGTLVKFTAMVALVIGKIEALIALTPGGAPLLAVLKQKHAALVEANTDVENGVAGAALARASIVSDVRIALGDMRHAVQKVGDADRPNAGAFFEKCGFRVNQERKPRGKRGFLVANTGVHGEARASIDAPKRRATIMFQASANGTDWTLEDSGSEAHYLFQDLTIGVTYSFRYRVKTAGKWGNFSDSVKLTIK